MEEYAFSYKPSSEQSEIIAHIVAGKNKGKNIYLNKENTEDIETDKLDLLYEFLDNYEKYNRISQKRLNKLVQHVKDDEKPDEQEDPQLRKLYDEFQTTIKKSNEIILKQSELQPVPLQGEKGQRQILFIAAASGAGKTTFIAQYCKWWNKLFGKSPIFLFSCKPLEDEEAYKTVKNIKAINLIEDNLDEIIEEGSYQYFISKLGQSLVIFDDFDAVDNKITKKLDVILNSVLQVGRSSRIYCIVSKHSLNASQKTKIIWSEATDIVLYPNGLSRYALTYAMQHYIGFDKFMIDKVLSSKSRWVQVHNRLPKYLLSQTSLMFLN
jgi:hypothetical protein